MAIESFVILASWRLPFCAKRVEYRAKHEPAFLRRPCVQPGTYNSPFPNRGCAAVVPSGVRTVRAHVVSWIGVTGSCNGLCLVSHGFRVFLVRKRSAAISRHRIPRKLDRKNKETTFLTLATLSLGDNVRPPGQTRLQPPSSPFCVPSASFRLLRFVCYLRMRRGE